MSVIQETVTPGVSHSSWRPRLRTISANSRPNSFSERQAAIRRKQGNPATAMSNVPEADFWPRIVF